MANVAFKKGLLTNLPAEHVEGTIYVTTDERALYLDISGSDRIRIGDFQEVENISALEEITSPSQTALYYVKDINCLAKYNGSEWKQINPDTGATNGAVDGAGASDFSFSYDEASRTLTLSVSKAFIDGDALDAKIGDLGESETVVAYITTKLEEISGEESTLSGRVGKLETAVGDAESGLVKDVNDLKTKVGETSVADQIAAAKTEIIGQESTTGEEDTIKAAKKYADLKDAELKTALVGEGEGITAETIKGAAKEVKDYTDEQIAAKIGSVYTPSGNKASVEDLGTPGESQLGKVYNMTADFDTDATFVEGAGKHYPAGTNVVCVNVGSDEAEYKWDSLSGVVDLSEYAKTADVDSKDAKVKTDLIGEDESVNATTIKAGVTEAKTYADTNDTALKTELIGEGASGEEETIKGAKKYTDEQLEKSLTWGSF